MMTFRSAVSTIRSSRPLLHHAAAVSAVVLLGYQTVALWLSVCGNSLPSLLALICAMLVALTIATLLRPLTGSQGRLPSFALPAALLLLTVAAFSVLPAVLTEALDAAARSLPSASIVGDACRFLMPAATVAIALVAPGIWLQQTCDENRHSQNPHLACALAGLLTVIGCLLFGNPAVAATVCGLLTAVTCVFRRTAHPSPAEPSPPQSTAQIWFSSSITGSVAASALIAGSTFSQPSLPLLFIETGLTLFIVSVVSMLTHILPGPRLLLKLIAPISLIVIPAAFPAIVHASLLWDSTDQRNWLQILQITGLLSVACTPLAIAVSGYRRQPKQSTGMIITAGMACGSAVALLTAQLVPAFLQLQLSAVLLASLTLFNRSEITTDLTSLSPVRKRPLPRMHLAVIMAAIVTAAALGTPESAPLSRLMFSERTRIALQREVAPELISQSAPGRLLEAQATSVGEVAVWKLSGNIVEFRRNGIAQGAASSSPEITPQPPQDVLPLILALCNHPQPGNVLLLGDDSGAALRSCTHFPILHITAVRQDEHITKLAAAHIWRHGTQNPADDNRVRITHQPIELAVRRTRPASMDAIVCNGPPASSIAAAALCTQEFYTAVRSALTSNGVFAQRFRSSDFGPEPLRQCLATLSHVFPASGAIQTVPGEIVLLATTSDKGLISPGMLDRLQKDHVRTELAMCGWDWAQVAVLPLADAADPVGLFSHTPRPACLSVASAQIALNWPLEASRNADKARELREAFAPWQKQLASALPVTEAHHEAKRRLSSLAQQIEILAGMPDQPWTYRRSLRMEMQQHPRPPLEKVENGRIIRISHPLDQQRQEYFQSLGNALMAAARNEQNALGLVRRLISFARSGDPLMGHFSHYEIVRLHELLRHPAPAEELQHRLHIVFFANPSDASVRPVISALDQLVRQPELISQPAERFDQLNALLQKLIERWEARTAWEPKSATRVQNDVDQSVRVSNLALDQMQELANTVGVSSHDFQNRRRYINQALIVPLRDYRDQVLAHRMKNTPAAADGEDPDDQPLLIPATQPLTTN